MILWAICQKILYSCQYFCESFDSKVRWPSCQKGSSLNLKKKKKKT